MAMVPDMPKTTSSSDMEKVSQGKRYLCLFFHNVVPKRSCGSSLFHCFRPKAFQHSCALNSVQSILHGDGTVRPYFMYNMKESMTKSLKNLPQYLHCSVWVWSSMGHRPYLYHVAHQLTSEKPIFPCLLPEPHVSTLFTSAVTQPRS